MSLRIPSERLSGFLSLGWRCTSVGDGWVYVEHDDVSPPVPCYECGDACVFGEWTRNGTLCWECFDDADAVPVWVH